MNITSILLIILVIGVLLCITKKNIIEKFVSNMEQIILDDNCPNYMVSDGGNYYLIFNHKEFDGINNPLIFNSKEEANIALKKLGCTKLLEPIYLRRLTNHDDPVESYERTCAKQTAKPLFSINDCAFTISTKSDDLGFEPINPESGAIRNITNDKIQELIQNNTKNMNDQDKYKLLRQITDFLNSKGTDTMVNYDIETCMIDKYANAQTPDLHVAGADIMQKFNKYFNMKANAQSSDQNFNNASIQQMGELDEQTLSEFNKYFSEANELAIPDYMVKRIFGVAEKL